MLAGLFVCDARTLVFVLCIAGIFVGDCWFVVSVNLGFDGF